MGPLGVSVRTLRPRCGLPEPTIPPVAERVNRYSTISKVLSRNGVDSRQCTEENLSALVLNLRSFLDTYFGHDAPSETRGKLTMFPMSIFTDFSEFGPLCALLHACFQYGAEHRMLPLNFDDAKRSDDLLQLILHVEKTLKKDHYFRVIKVFISPLLEQEETDNLRDIARGHGAAIVSNPHVATHLVYPDPEGTLEHQTDGQVLVRVLERTTFGDQTFCLLHWLHHPDSYNDWVPSSDVLGHVNVPRRRKEREQWHVQGRWLRDLEIHNEWMNELDYEMPAYFAAFLGRSPKPAKLDARGMQKSALVRIRLRMPKEDEIVKRANQFEPSKRVGLPSLANGFNEGIDEDDGDGNQTMVDIGNLSDVKIVDSGGSDNPDISSGSSSSLGADGSPGQTTKLPVGDGVFIPFFAKWFSTQSVHDIERRALPEFFKRTYASKTEGTYKETRNFIVKTWRQSRNEYLSGTAVRRHLAGDACAVLRLHGFLEHWGLINYDCSTQGAAPASFIPPPRPLPLRAGHAKEDSVRMGPQLVLDDGSKLSIKAGKVTKFGRHDEVLGNDRSEAVLIRDTDRTGQTASIAEPPAREPIEYHCDSCGTDCSVLRFHCATKADVDLCAPCYQNAKYSSSMKPRDFIQMNSAGVHGGPDETDSDVWTESETLLLLEALEMYGDNWTLVSEHVGSKGKSQCVMQFLRLPIEDAFLNKTTRSWWGVAPPGNADEKSPADMLRVAGARESALATVNTKGSCAKAFSGQPLVFGDQISTIIPFVRKLASRCPPEILKEVTHVLGTTFSRKRKRNYLDLLVKETHENAHGGSDNVPEEPIEEMVESFTTDRVYKRLRKMVPVPAQFLRTEHGERLARGAFSLVKHGAIPVTDIMQLQLDPSPQALALGFAVGSGGFLGGVVNEVPVTGAAEASTAKLNGHAPTDSVNPTLGSDPDIEASTALAIASFGAASASASYRQEVEQAEIDRLYSLLSEVRVQIIRRRLAHLTAIAEYEDFAEQYNKQKLSEEMSRRVLRQTESVRSRAVEDEILAQGGTGWTSSGEASMEMLDAGQPANSSPPNHTGTAQSYHAAEIARAAVPDFSGEVSLQQIRGTTPDGRIVTEEGVEIMAVADPAVSSAQG